MTAVGILGGYVRTTGDTMSGDLILSNGADLQAQAVFVPTAGKFSTP
jgi:hypothetical protein